MKYLKCKICSKKVKVTDTDIMRYLASGFPMCHGEIMEILKTRGCS